MKKRDQSYLTGVLFIALALAGCGSSGAPGGGASLAIKVTGARSFNPYIEHGRIEKYRVTVRGDGIEQPVYAEFAGEVTEGIIEGIPCGDNRSVAVEAINANALLIRAGEKGDVKIGGGVNEVEVALEAVPIFANLADGNSIDNTRLVFKIFSDPSNPVALEEIEEGVAKQLVDASLNNPEIHLDVSTGMGSVSPALIAPGRHEFRVVDLVTGRSSRVNVMLLDGTKMKPAPLVSATQINAQIRACSSPACAAAPMPARW